MNKARLFRAARPGDRKKYYRGAGLAADALPAVVVDEKSRRLAALVKLQGLLGFGTGQTQGKHAWISYPAALMDAAARKISALHFRRVLTIKHARNGARCHGPGWARVLIDGVTVEVVEAEEVRGPLSVVSSQETV